MDLIGEIAVQQEQVYPIYTQVEKVNTAHCLQQAKIDDAS